MKLWLLMLFVLEFSLFSWSFRFYSSHRRATRTKVFMAHEQRPKLLKLPEQYFQLTSSQQFTYPIQALKYRIKKHPKLGERIEFSLSTAAEKAKKYLKSNLFVSLEWPTTLKDYYSYLERFIRF